MYTKEMLESIKKVEANREANAALEPRRMTAEEKDALLKAYHPDYKEGAEFVNLAIGPNKGDKVPKELGALLQGRSRIQPRLRHRRADHRRRRSGRFRGHRGR